MDDNPEMLADVIRSMPSTCSTDRSIGVVMVRSTISGLAPGKMVEMVATGTSKRGR